MILAVPLRTIVTPEDSVWKNRYYLCDHYKTVFDQLGVTLFPVMSDNCAEEICRICDGLILSGTEKNIYPEYYGHSRLPEMEHTYTVDEYAKDKPLVDAFVKAGKPILGICGGLQVLNVYFGGTLNQLVPGHTGKAEGHSIRVEKDSFLYRVYGKELVDVNTYHRQCALDVAPGFSVSARAEDGTIEAIEKGNIIAVQWHPEVAVDMPFFRTFLKTFF